MSRKLIIFLVFLLTNTLSCSRSKQLEPDKTPPVKITQKPIQPPEVSPPPKPNSPPLPTPPPVSRDPEIDARVDRLANADVTGLRLLSPRSLSMKIWLEGGGAAVFKPLHKKDRRARFEVAAFLIAELFNMDNVPQATMRAFRPEFLALRLDKTDKENADRFRSSAFVSNNQVYGAIIQWVDDIDPNGLETLGGTGTVKGWLFPARPRAASEHTLSDDASEMVVFDYFIGNWDRFSGGNFFVANGGERLVLLDHNGTFTKWTGKRKEKMERLLRTFERFPKKLITRIREVDHSQIEAALNREPWHKTSPILSENEINLIFERRETLLAYIDKLIAEKGEANVLVFE